MALKAYIVEDNPAIRDSLSEALAELAGIATVGLSTSALQAADWLADPANDWDLAIVDLLLDAGSTGLEVLRQLQGRKPGRKVVVLTATASGMVAGQCRALGADEVFDKSVDTDALLDWCMRLAGRPDGPVAR